MARLVLRAIKKTRALDSLNALTSYNDENGSRTKRGTDERAPPNEELLVYEKR